MHTTWRVRAAHWLLGAGAAFALLLALASTAAGPVPDWATPVAWAAFATVAAGLVASWLHHRQLERFRRHLATGLTHHMRTSLAHIQAYNEMLLLGNESSEGERHEWLEVIGREAERLGAAVENVLMIINEKRRDAFPVRRSVDLGALLEDVACGCSGPGGRGVRFVTSPPAGILVNADPSALRHALGNLLETFGRCCDDTSPINAALSTNGETATLVLTADDHVRRLSRAASNGTALREEDLEGETGAGFGLELAVVQHVTAAHGGRTETFHDGGRSGFRIELPVVG